MLILMLQIPFGIIREVGKRARAHATAASRPPLLAHAANLTVVPHSTQEMLNYPRRLTLCSAVSRPRTVPRLRRDLLN